VTAPDTRRRKSTLGVGDEAIVAHFFDPEPKPCGAVIIAPAMGVAQRYYWPFAEWLSSHGFLVVTFDFQGTGLSTFYLDLSLAFIYSTLSSINRLSTEGRHMANEGYHEPIEELSDATRDMHRAITSLMEELEAVDWYNQRVDACKDKDLKAILAHNRDEEKEHAAMVLEWIRRQDSTFSKELTDYLFTDKPIAHR